MGGDWTQTGYRAISANNVKHNGLQNLEDIRCITESYKKWMKEEVEKGTFSHIRSACWSDNDLGFDEKVVSQRLFGLRANTHFSNRYLKYYLQSDLGQREINRLTSGSTVAGISAKMLTGSLLITRKKMRKKISAAASSLDAKIELNNRIN